MSLDRIAIALFFGVIHSVAAAQDVSGCDVALRPTEEKSASDYALAQSYMYVNAQREYDRLQQSTDEGRSASASYKFFKAEYDDSRSSSEFSEKIRDRLTRENFALSEAESRSSYRRYLSPAQLSGWSDCIQSIKGGGAILMSAESVARSAFPIRVRWYPQRGVGEGKLTIAIRNATIEGKATLERSLKGASEFALIVDPDNSSNQIVITADIEGAADALVLPRAFPASRPDSPKVRAKPRTPIKIEAAQFVRPLNIEVASTTSIYGGGTIHNAPPYNDAPNRVEYEFDASPGGNYLLKIGYAAAVPRPVQISINGELIFAQALGASTGCWEPACRSLLNQGRVKLREGFNVLKIERSSVFPHIRTIEFLPVD